MKTTQVQSIIYNIEHGEWCFNDAWNYLELSLSRSNGAEWVQEVMQAKKERALECYYKGSKSFQSFLAALVKAKPATAKRRRVTISRFADEMRANPTTLEAKHFQVFQSNIRIFRGVEIEKQHIVRRENKHPFIVDAMLIKDGCAFAWEIDGPFHDGKERRKTDRARDKELVRLGYRVIRTRYNMNHQTILETLCNALNHEHPTTLPPIHPRP